ncbi:DUF3301 domain-containing protein [Dokdonella sp.]|uniref:DUF3301 domain-containing protein n=1 Tax=Dokdonella sp. TaxID=2291710 RepID=UPI0025C1D4CE|nr:DUF3301 domain-containing protein [Dokdonella sp.]MBX3688443.1 DUF3301 domain-containing protein [Dokdonella sp.]
MSTTLIALLVIASLVWAWMDVLRAREFAIAHGHRLCAEAGLQLLDQSVAVRRVRLVWHQGLPSVLRRYAFEVSVDGSDRRPGHLELEGHRLISWSLPLAVPPSEAPARPLPHLTVVNQPGSFT